MITNIVSNSRYLFVTNLQSNWSPQAYTKSSSDLVVGDIRFSSGNLEYWNGSCWTILNQTATIYVNPDTEALLEWVKEKRDEELRERDLLAKSPALRKAKENYDIIKALIEDGE